VGYCTGQIIGKKIKAKKYCTWPFSGARQPRKQLPSRKDLFPKGDSKDSRMTGLAAQKPVGPELIGQQVYETRS